MIKLNPENYAVDTQQDLIKVEKFLKKCLTN